MSFARTTEVVFSPNIQSVVEICLYHASCIDDGSLLVWGF